MLDQASSAAGVSLQQRNVCLARVTRTDRKTYCGQRELCSAESHSTTPCTGRSSLVFAHRAPNPSLTRCLAASHAGTAVDETLKTNALSPRCPCEYTRASLACQRPHLLSQGALFLSSPTEVAQVFKDAAADFAAGVSAESILQTACSPESSWHVAVSRCQWTQTSSSSLKIWRPNRSTPAISMTTMRMSRRPRRVFRLHHRHLLRR